MADEPSPHFIHILRITLGYWQRLTADLDDALIITIDPDRRNLREAIDMGLSFPQTCVLAGEVAWQSFFLAERRGYWSEWISFFERALRQCPALQPQQRPRLLHRLGELYRYGQRLEEAVAVHKQAEALAQELDDALALAEARYRLCWDYLEMRQYKEAEAYGRFALDTFTRLGMRQDLLTNSYWALGSNARRRGELETAKVFLSQAIEQAVDTQHSTHRARMIAELGVLLTEQQLYSEASLCIDQAAAILAPTMSERDKINVEINRAALLYRQEQWQAAELTWKQAANSEYLRQSGEMNWQALLARNLAIVSLKQLALSEAEAQIRYALQLQVHLEDEVEEANALGILGQVRARQKKGQEARHLFNQARQILLAYPEDAHARNTLRTIEAELQALDD